MKDLVKISKYSGMREDLVQAGGGNSSIKLDEKRMAIKASGVQLADVTEDSGYSIVDYPIIVQYMQDLIEGKTTETDKEILERALIEGKRSSIETFLHAITGRVTLHTHSTAVNVMTARMGGMERLKQLFPDALMVGYATPGVRLAELYYRTFQESCGGEKRQYPIIFLKNHGVIVSGDTAGKVIALTENVCKKIEQEIGMNNNAYHRAFDLYQKFREWEPEEDKIVVKVENATILALFAQQKYKIWDFQICPDCIVFCGKSAFAYKDNCDRIGYVNYVARFGSPVIICSGQDIFIRAESVRKAKEIESVLAFSAQVALFNQGKEMDLLSDEEQNFLLNWDAEKYRQMVK